jgi:hypothetical protein
MSDLHEQLHASAHIGIRSLALRQCEIPTTLDSRSFASVSKEQKLLTSRNDTFIGAAVPNIYAI